MQEQSIQAPAPCHRGHRPTRAASKAAFVRALFDGVPDSDEMPPGIRAYAVLDGAHLPNLPATLARHGDEHQCLFAGALSPDMARVSPYLVTLSRGSRTLEWWLEYGWGQHGGIGLRVPTKCPFKLVRRHLRNFLQMRGPDGTSQLFRFYDPRVLSDFLPALPEVIVSAMFNDVVEAYLGQAPSGEIRRYTAAKGRLQVTGVS